MRRTTHLLESPRRRMGVKTSAFVDHGPHSPSSTRERNGKAVSWCHTTSQLAAADLSRVSPGMARRPRRRKLKSRRDHPQYGTVTQASQSAGQASR